MENRIKKISKNSIKEKILLSERINHGIGNDVFLIFFNKKKYILRIENNSKNSKLKILRHFYFLKMLKKEFFVQQIIKHGVIDGKFYFITNYCEGNVCHYLTNSNFKLLDEALRKIHQYTFLDIISTNKEIGRTEYISWSIFLDNELKKIKCIKIPQLTKIILKTEKEYKYFESVIKKRQNNSLIHFDLNLGNILFNKNNLFILDWENSIIGDPLADYAILNNFCPNFKKNIINENGDNNDLFIFYRKFFLLREIYYKIKYKISIKYEIKKIIKFSC